MTCFYTIFYAFNNGTMEVMVARKRLKARHRNDGPLQLGDNGDLNGAGEYCFPGGSIRQQNGTKYRLLVPSTGHFSSGMENTIIGYAAQELEEETGIQIAPSNNGMITQIDVTMVNPPIMTQAYHIIEGSQNGGNFNYVVLAVRVLYSHLNMLCFFATQALRTNSAYHWYKTASSYGTIDDELAEVKIMTADQAINLFQAGPTNVTGWFVDALTILM